MNHVNKIFRVPVDMIMNGSYFPSGRKGIICYLVTYRSFSRDVIIFQNLKLKIHQSFNPHQALEAVCLHLFIILKLDSVLCLEARAF